MGTTGIKWAFLAVLAVLVALTLVGYTSYSCGAVDGRNEADRVNEMVAQWMATPTPTPWLRIESTSGRVEIERPFRADSNGYMEGNFRAWQATRSYGIEIYLLGDLIVSCETEDCTHLWVLPKKKPQCDP